MVAFCCAPPSSAIEDPSPIILLFYFSSLAQEVLPLTNLLSPQEKFLIIHPEEVSLLWPL
jgi:hypothetical protein